MRPPHCHAALFLDMVRGPAEKTGYGKSIRLFFCGGSRGSKGLCTDRQACRCRQRADPVMSPRIVLAAYRLRARLKLVRYFESEFARAGAKAPRLRVRYAKAGNPPQDILVERHGGEMTLVVEDVGKRRVTRLMQQMICAYAYWLSLCPPQVKRITVNTSDGETVTRARFAASVRFSRHIALPDPHFFQNGGFESERQAGRSAPQWQDRSDGIVWRGGLNGNGWLSFSPEDRDNPAVMQRLRMVMRLKDSPGTDVRFSDLQPSVSTFRPFAVRQGLLGSPIAAGEWLGKKFAIDIDGYTNTWSNLLVRMLYGCCVLKVESQFGFRQWYYDEIRPLNTTCLCRPTWRTSRRRSSGCAPTIARRRRSRSGARPWREA